MTARRAHGFTLIELLVAMAIVAVIGVMAMTGLSVQDLAQLQPRATRDELGETYVPSLSADPNGQFALEFSRGGWANPGGFPRGTVLRVAYNFEGDKLVRYHWPVMDRTTATPPVRTELLDGVTNVQVRYLDGTGMWQLDWPPVAMAGPQRLIERPRAVEFAIELKDFGRVMRLVETTG
jgi:general secretion pathway protein J